MKALPLVCCLTIWLCPSFVSGQEAFVKGIKGEYYKGTRFETHVVTRIDPAIHFNWTKKESSWMGSERDFRSPAPGVPAEYFSARWTGELNAPESGIYTLEATVDDGIRVWLGGILILDKWKNTPVTTYTVDVELQAGRHYPIKVEYFQVRWDACLMLKWRRPSQPETADAEPIASSYFSTPAPQKPKPFAPIPSDRGVEEAPLAPPPSPAPKPKRAPKIEAEAGAARPSKQPRLAPLRRGAVISLPNVYFELNTSQLLESSAPMLDQLVEALRAQPELNIVIAGHTDLAQDKARSQALSLERADVVRLYLIQKGIEANRLTTKGFGCSQPLLLKSDACNRRVEVAVQ